MNNQNNRATKPTRLTRAIVASGSLLAIIVVGLPSVDEYFRLRRNAVELSELESKYSQIQTQAVRLQRVEESLTKQLQEMVVRSVDPSKTEFIRESLIESVRQAGGRIRRLEIAAGENRAWAIENDNPHNGTLPIYGEESRFTLHTHTVDLQADGSLESIRQVLSSVHNQGWLMTIKNLTMSPTSIRQSPVSLELRLVMYGLSVSETEPEEDYAKLNNLVERR